MTYGMVYGSTPYGGPYPKYACPYYVDDYLDKMLVRLTDQFRIKKDPAGGFLGPQNLAKLLNAKSIPLQDFEDVCCEMVAYRLLSTAKGANLDWYGDLLKLGRADYATWGDEEYRRLLRAEVLVNVSAGEYDDIYDIIDTIVLGENYRKIDRLNPHSFHITTDGEVINDSHYYNAIDRAKPVISQFQIVIAVPDSETPFYLAANDTRYAVPANGGGAATIAALKTSFSPVLTAGDFVDGQVVITDGTSSTDVRTIDGTGAVDAGVSWSFTVTANFTAPPDATSVFNVSPDSVGAGFAAETYSGLTAVFGTGNTITIAQASFAPVIFAGDFASGQIIITDGTAQTNVRTIDINGAVASGANWTFTVSSNFTATPDGTSKLTIASGGGLLGRVVTGE